jgi:hypothetical protein
LEAKANSGLASAAAPAAALLLWVAEKRTREKKAQNQIKTLNKTRGVSHHWPFHLHKKVSSGKRRIMEIQIFQHAKIYNLQKK